MTPRALHGLAAPAKLNAFLHVVGRRADGYHLLQSAFVLLDWYDTLHLDLRDDGRLARHDLGAVLPADDLCLRAARALQAASGCTLGADIRIDKQLPSGAGLGGGSSDAATVLLGLNRLWDLNWPRARLLELAATLGADVPFFVGGHNAFVEGIGERLTPLAWPLTWYAVVKPPVSLSTADVFQDPDLKRDSDAAILMGSFASAAGKRETVSQAGTCAVTVQALAEGWGRNDLQPTAQALCPEVAHAARWLEARFGNSRMTGSGSAVFARAGTLAAPTATFTQDELPARWVGRMCRSLDRHPLAGWLD